MNWLRITLLFIALLVVGTGVWYLFSTDPGYLLVTLRGYSLEMTLLTALGALLLLGLAGWLLWILIGSPFKKWRGHRSGLAQERLAAGLIALREGRVKDAEKLLTKAAKNETLRLASVVYGAQAAHDRGQADHARALFDSIEGPLVGELRSLDVAEANLSNEAPESALQALAQYPQYDVPRKTEIEFRALVDSKQWDKALALLPAVSYSGLMKPAALTRIEQMLVNGCLQGAENLDALKNHFNGLSKAQKQEPHMVLAVAKRAQTLGDEDYATQLIEKALKRSWSGELMHAYSELQHLDVQKRLKYVEKSLKEHDGNPHMHLAMGKLCADSSLWGKAESHLNKAKHLGLVKQADIALADTLKAQGRTTEALAAAMEALAQEKATENNESSSEILALPSQ